MISNRPIRLKLGNDESASNAIMSLSYALLNNEGKSVALDGIKDKWKQAFLGITGKKLQEGNMPLALRSAERLGVISRKGSQVALTPKLVQFSKASDRTLDRIIKGVTGSSLAEVSGAGWGSKALKMGGSFALKRLPILLLAMSAYDQVIGGAAKRTAEGRALASNLGEAGNAAEMIGALQAERLGLEGTGDLGPSIFSSGVSATAQSTQGIERSQQEALRGFAQTEDFRQNTARRIQELMG